MAKLGPGMVPEGETHMRRFGIELEMIAPAAHGGSGPLAHAAAIINAAGVRARTSRYSGRDYTQWQVKSDGSIQPAGRAAEVVSRILPASESSYDEITRAVAPLEAAGYGVNRTCGFHCHVNVSDLPLHVRQLIILRYNHVQGDFNAMLPPSRRANSYCEPYGDSRAAALARAIDTGSDSIPSSRGVCNTGHMYRDHYGADMGTNARIEFRQAAGTCSPAKVIAWVRLLQEFVDEVARRAAGVRFGNASNPAPMPRPTPVVRPLRPANPMASVPRMREGSDADRVLTRLCQQGAVSTSWAAEQGIVGPVMRRIIVGLRRHGADLTTTPSIVGPVYVLNGAHALPVSRERVFAGTPAAPVAEPVAVPPAVVIPAVVRAATFVDYPFFAGLSVATVAWVRQRIEDIAEANGGTVRAPGARDDGASARF